MYSRCARRAASRSLSASRSSQLVHRRRLATENASSGSTSTPVDVLSDATSDPSAHASTNLIDFVNAVAPHKEDATPARKPSAFQHPAPKQKWQTDLADLSANTPGVLIRPENGTKSMPAALAIVQDIERRFGKVRDFKCVQDKDALNEYLPFIFISFESPGSVERIRRVNKGVFTVTAAPWDRTKLVEGGVGLEDIKDYLRPAPTKSDEFLNDVVSNVETILDATEAGTEVEIGDGVVPAEEVPTPQGTLEEQISLDSVEVPTSTQLDEPLAGEPVSIAGESGEGSIDSFKLQDEFECHVEILGRGSNDSVFFAPVYHNPHLRRRVPTAVRIRMARAFVAWGGFYQGYDFRNESTEIDPESEASPVHMATRAMRASILHNCKTLMDEGDPSHGLVQLDGQWTVAKWFDSEGHETARHVDIPGTEGVEQANGESRPVQSIERMNKGTSEEVSAADEAENAVPAAVTKPLQKDIAQKNVPSRKEKAKSKPRSQVSVSSLPSASSSASATSASSSSPSAFAFASAPFIDKPSSASPVSAPLHVKSKLEELKAAKRAEVQNNRTRRRAQKEEKERLREKESFKEKLFGWVRSSWR